MCLLLSKKNSTSQISVKPLKVWTIRRITLRDNQYLICSPYFQDTKWKIRVLRKAEGKIEKIFNSKTSTYRIFGGAFHFFTTYEAASIHRDFYLPWNDFNAQIFEAEVPINTRFWINEKYETGASKALILINRVTGGI